MTVESYFELFLALFGWQQYNHLWEILTGTGLAYLPFLFILLLNIIGPLTSQETRDAATTSVKRMEVDLFIAFSVVVLAAAPAIDLNASVLSYKKPCDTLSGPAGTFTPGNTGTTFDAVFAEVIATPTRVPVWWWGIMAISSGINREGIAGIGCAADLSGLQMKMASTRITDPALMQELALFIRYCYRPAHSKFLRDKPDVGALQASLGRTTPSGSDRTSFLRPRATTTIRPSARVSPSAAGRSTAAAIRNTPTRCRPISIPRTSVGPFATTGGRMPSGASGKRC